MAKERQGFLGRWARRKTDVLQGKPLQAPAAVEKPAPVLAASPIPVKAKPAVAQPAAADPTEQPEKLPGLDDVKLLTKDSDFTPFMARDVGPDVRNAAMKKLFADPHYNVMDGLDIYIDDYSISDPIPESMLRQMAGAKLLKIFDDEEDEKDKDAAASAPADNPNKPTSQTVAQSGELTGLTRPNSLTLETPSQPESFAGSGASQHDHAHSHLRLQPDHAPSAPDAGRGAS
jgi:hypothetical protein